MKKSLFTIALMALLLVFTSGLNHQRPGIGKGEIAPEISLSNPSSQLKLSQLRGQYVLLSFWSSTNAASRIANNKYNAWFNAHNPEDLSHVSVNFDEQPELFSAISKRDGLDQQAQYNVSGEAAKEIVKDYGLSHGYGSVLIGPDGRIIKFNPDQQELEQISNPA